MHRKRLFTCLLLSLVGVTDQNAFAQTGEPALARVIYEFTHINDTLQPDKPHKEEMVLYIGRYTSSYATYANERLNEQIMKQVDDPGFDGNLTITGSGRNTPESYYAAAATQTFHQVYSLAGERYLIQETYPEIKWEVSEETREIGGYNTQKAAGRFGGREFTVWFTTDVPFQGGPWKLLGLPGLVLEAVDAREHVAFRYAGFETLPDTAATVSLPEHAIATSKKALDRLVQAYRKNPEAAMSARTKGGGSGVRTSAGGLSAIDPSRIKSINIRRDDGQTSPVTNNPLELSMN